MNSRTKIKSIDDRNPVSWVLPPEAATAKDRDIEAEDGRHRKKAPKTLQNPYTQHLVSTVNYRYLLIWVDSFVKKWLWENDGNYLS